MEVTTSEEENLARYYRFVNAAITRQYLSCSECMIKGCTQRAETCILRWFAMAQGWMVCVNICSERDDVHVLEIISYIDSGLRDGRLLMVDHFGDFERYHQEMYDVYSTLAIKTESRV